MQSNDENKYKIISAGSTLLLIGLLMIVCLSFGYMPPDPPIPESGVEVSLGYSASAFGNSNQINNGGEVSRPATSATSAQNDLTTQSTEESLSLPDKAGQDSKNLKPDPQKTKTTEDNTKQVAINSNAIYKGSKKGEQGGNRGNKEGEGSMGEETGNPNATGYAGNGGTGGGNGPGWSLIGRHAEKLPEPEYKSPDEGKIVITVQVDRNGHVVSAENSRGSTIKDQALVNQAIKAALKSKFSASETAKEKQKGTITYVFRKTN